ncbi:MAG: L-lactate permease [Pirellulaceae bacterium]
MSVWHQIYVPVGRSVLWSALVASLPVVVLLGLVGFTRIKAHIAALLGLLVAIGVAVTIYQMPVDLATMAALHGALYGLLPIGWIVLNAIFLFDLTVASGDFQLVKRSITLLASDRRIQVLLIAFSFGAFIEGAAGFGTPVAISAAMLIGIGFRPLEAAGLSLLGNTAPVAFGALGTPLIALAAVTDLPLGHLSAAAGRILPLFSLLVPFWLVWVMAGVRGALEVWPACLVAGGSFALVQFLVSNYHGPWLVDVAGAIASIAALILLLRFWKPAHVWRFEWELEDQGGEDTVTDSSLAVLRAWMPWAWMTLFVFVWGTPQFKQWIQGGAKESSSVLASISKFEIPIWRLHEAVIRVPPVVSKPMAEPAIFKVEWMAATGTGLLLAALVSGLCLGFGPRRLFQIYCGTLFRVRLSLLTIAAMLALGFVTKAAGLDATMGLAFASTWGIFQFFSALLVWLGVAMTGSDTSSNVLFGGLQRITAEQLGLNPILTAAANTTGGVMGKMIDAQSLVVASVATGHQGEEGQILRYVFWHSVGLAALVGCVVFAYARILPSGWMPSP